MDEGMASSRVLFPNEKQRCGMAAKTVIVWTKAMKKRAPGFGRRQNGAVPWTRPRSDRELLREQ